MKDFHCVLGTEAWRKEEDSKLFSSVIVDHLPASPEVRPAYCEHLLALNYLEQGAQCGTVAIVHAHFNSEAADVEPARVHIKRDAKKDGGVDKKPYRSLRWIRKLSIW